MCLGPPGFFEGKSSDAIGLFRGEWVVYACSDEDSLYSLGVGEAERLRNEIRELQDEIKALSDKVGDAKAKGEEKEEKPQPKKEETEAVTAAPADSPGETQQKQEKQEGAGKEEGGEEEEKEENEGGGKKNEDDSEEEDDFGDDDEDDDAEDDWKPPTAYMKKGQRGSVSAEAYGAFNQKKAFEPPVYEKSTEQEERINADDLKVILGAFLEKKIPAGERIIQEGDDGDVMFLIESGAFDCIKKIDGSDKATPAPSHCDVFGELALLYNCPRAASVEATEEAVVWQLDRETFRPFPRLCRYAAGHIVRDASAKRRDNFMDFLKTVPLFKPLESYDLMQLADCLQQQTLAEGETILKQGDSGDTFYLVEEGDLVATKTREGSASLQAR
eukprot:s660_g10.t1